MQLLGNQVFVTYAFFVWGVSPLTEERSKNLNKLRPPASQTVATAWVASSAVPSRTLSRHEGVWRCHFVFSPAMRAAENDWLSCLCECMTHFTVRVDL